MTMALPKTLYTIQALRAIAAGAVVSYHVLVMLVHNGGYSFPVSEIGASGVDLFFVISGFIMVYTNQDLFQQPRASLLFLRRRLIRIVPAYWIYTTVVVLLLLFLPRLFATTTFELPHVVSSYFFLLSGNSTGQVGTVLQTGWTLCYEMYFYLLFAILLNLPRQYFLPLAGTVFLAGIVLGNAAALPAWATVATNPILLEFYLGALLGFAFVRGFYLRRPVAVAALIVAVAAIMLTGEVDLGPWTRVVCWGLPGALLLLGAISLELHGVRMPRLLASLGDSSYSLYLAHPLLVPVFGKIWVMLHLAERLPAAALFLVALTGALIAGHVAYLVLEKPMTRWLSQIWKNPERAVAEGGAMKTGMRLDGGA